MKRYWGAKNLRGKDGLVTEVYKRWPKYIEKSEIREEILEDEEYE